MNREETKLTGTIKTRIVKPIGDRTWDDLGTTFRALRSPLHRVLNTVVRELEVPHYEREEWWGHPNKRDLASPRTASYRVASSAWGEERDAAEKRDADGRAYALDKAVARMPPSSALVLGAASAAFARWNKFDKERWRGTMSLPSFSGDSPIYITGAGVDLRAENGNYIASLSLLSGGGRVEVVLGVDGGSAHQHLRSVFASESKSGDAKIIQVRDKWMLFISLTWTAPKVTCGRTMAVHRGIRNLVSVAVARSESTEKRDARTAILETGDDIVVHKAAYSARRRSLGQQLRQSGAGARGHGEKRRLEAVTRLEDAERRWVRSKCQEVAAHVCRMGAKFGVTRVLLEDWTNPAKDGAPELGDHVERLVRSFPFRQLRDAVEWAAKKRGWTVDIVIGKNNSRDCPNCGHHSELATDNSLFRCSKCELERPIDMIAAWNMLRNDGKTPGLEEVKETFKRKRAEFRPKKV